jgi:hypothetical protein
MIIIREMISFRKEGNVVLNMEEEYAVNTVNNPIKYDIGNRYVNSSINNVE